MGRITEIIENGEVQPIEDNQEETQDENLVVEQEETPEPDEKQEPVAESDEEVTVSIGEEPAKEEDTRAPEWVRELRKQHREAQKRIRELESQIQPQVTQTKLAAKPKLEDFDYDTDKFELALEGWYEQKRKYESEQEEQKRAIENEQKSWQERLTNYQSQKSTLKVKDFDDAEDLVKESLNVVQQGVILQGAENPALVVYALGKNPKKAQELASIKDPVKFAFAVAKLEKDLKVTGKRTPPPPEKSVSAVSAPISGSVDSTLERLREEAAKTGDYTKVTAYKKQLRAKSN